VEKGGICKIAYSLKRIEFSNDIFPSSSYYCKGRNLNKFILSRWIKQRTICNTLRPAVIKSFVKVDIILGNSTRKSVIFAECKWLRPHPY